MQSERGADANDVITMTSKQRHEAAVMEGLRSPVSRLTPAELKRVRKLVKAELEEGLNSPLRKYTKNHFAKLVRSKHSR